MLASEILLFCAMGIPLGLLTGMMGLGGGIISVPTLASVLMHHGLPLDAVMRIATATSLAVMCISMSVTLCVNREERAAAWLIVKRWLAALLLGALIGALLAHHIRGAWLTLIFGLFLLVLAVKGLIQSRIQSNQHTLPGTWSLRIFGFLMGVLSSMLGIGGGILILPYLMHYHVEMQCAITVVAMGGLIVALFSTAIAIILGWHQPGLPLHTLGYVYWPAWFGLTFTSVIFIPLGIRLAKHLPAHVLKKIFAVILFITGAHMVIVAYAALSSH